MNETPARRPMTFTFLELLDRTFRIYRENFLTMVGLVALVTIPITVVNLLLDSATPTSFNSQSLRSAMAASSGASLISSILNLVQTVLIYAPLTYMASEYLFNRKVSIREAFSNTNNRFLKVGCGLIVMGIAIGIFAVAFILLGAIFPPIFVLIGILIYIFVSASALIFPVLTLEDIGPSAGVTRSYSLSKRRFWVVVGVGFILAIIGGLIGLILGGSATFLVVSVMPNSSYMAQTALITFLTTLVNIIITPLSPIAFTLLYYDIRTRSEGLDIMLDSTENSGARPVNFATPQSKFGLDRHDWRNIAILTLVGLVIALATIGPIMAYVNQFSRTLR